MVTQTTTELVNAEREVNDGGEVEGSEGGGGGGGEGGDCRRIALKCLPQARQFVRVCEQLELDRNLKNDISNCIVQ